MKFAKLLFFYALFVLFLSGCMQTQASEKEFDPKCVEYAKELFPSKITLNFNENNADNLDALELDYFLEYLVFNDGTKIMQDRGFHKLKSRNSQYYYPFDSSTKVSESWPHTEKITYEKQIYENGEIIGINKFVYDLKITPTSIVEYAIEQNPYTKKFEENIEKGERVFIVDEIIIEECLITKEEVY